MARIERQWSQRITTIENPLFAGYSFCRFGRSDYARVMRLPGVAGVVRFGSTLAAIDQDEIEALRTISAAECPVEPCEYFPNGQGICVVDGPLKGVSGTILQDRGRVDLAVSVTILQRAVRVVLPRESVVVSGEHEALHQPARPIHPAAL